MLRRALPLGLVCLTFQLTACRDPEANDGDGDDETGGSPECFELADGTCVDETFSNPPTLEPDADGVHPLELAATEVT
ncbi:MAG TPA: hypothetical protein VM869_21390, partial [Enhygromyxa sp.]|nr:hypothetical protein [Enhygromyxa sp.]